MNELYLGTAEEMTLVANYLQEQRENPPIDKFRLKSNHALITLVTNKITEAFDSELFAYASDLGLRYLQELAPDILAIGSSRYFVGITDDKFDKGGFYSPYGIGYYHYNNIAYTVLLNTLYTSSSKLIALELCRSYLHDCIHMSTFRSYRICPTASGSNPKVSRYQYGINYRDCLGNSYSAPDMTQKYPKAINLNLLMDGVATIIVSKVMKKIIDSISFAVLDDLEIEIISELKGEVFDSHLYPDPVNHYKTVVNPTKKFIKHWKIDISVILRAMISGDIEMLKNIFNTQMGIANAWEFLFKQDAFSG